MADEESAYSSYDDFDILPDKVKKAMKFKPVKPGPFEMINLNPNFVTALSPMNLSPTKDYRQNVRKDSSNSSIKTNDISKYTIPTPQEILKNASTVNEINKFPVEIE